MMEHVPECSKLCEVKGVVGVSIGNDLTHSSASNIATYQAQVPGYKRIFSTSSSTSQPDIKINSSLAVNVTDLKRKIVGLEHQLDEVSRHCRDIAVLDNVSRRESNSTLSQYALKPESTTNYSSITSDQNPNDKAKLLVSKCLLQKANSSDITANCNNDIHVDSKQTVMNGSDGHVSKVKNKIKLHKSNSSKLWKHKTRSSYDNNIGPVCSSSSFRSLAARLNHHHAVYPSLSNDKRHLKDEYIEEIIRQHHMKNETYKENKKKIGDQLKDSEEDKPMIRMRKHKRPRNLDPDFIADIIQRQYKPVKLFNKKESDRSQFSAPVCRDQELSAQENIPEEAKLCNCLYEDTADERPRRLRPKELNGMQSVCDARIYSTKKTQRHKQRRLQLDAYSNSDMYDLVPVKERSSPKTRRKFVEDNSIPYEYYKEVPPSPTTMRPRLNLKAQLYTDVEEQNTNSRQPRKHSPKIKKRQKEYTEQFDTDIISEIAPVEPEKNVHQRRSRRHIKEPVEEKQVPEVCQQNFETMSSLQYPQFANEQTNITVDTIFNKTQEIEVNVDKTDKTLCEIKSILQNFLHEIKKETVASQCDKSDTTSKIQDTESNLLDNSKINNNTSFNNYNVGQCGVSPYIAPFTNTCCYPVMPLCSMNCPMSVPNGYIMPSQSFTCANCVNVPKESNSAHCCNVTDGAGHTETDELIKEIYKFVAQGPSRNKETDSSDGGQNELKKCDSKILTSRSVGGSYKCCHKDANVGTQSMKCYSKSCEAIGTGPGTAEAYYGDSTNGTYSDSLLEKLSLEVTTHSISETELQSECSEQKDKVNRFSKVLRTLGIFKKKKKDVIEELSETESVLEEEAPTGNPPFRQEITNYMMYGQEYYRQPHSELLYQRPQFRHDRSLRPHEYPPYPDEYHRPHDYYQRPNEYQPDYHPPYNPGARGYPSPQLQDVNGRRYQQQTHGQHQGGPSHGQKQSPTAPPFNNTYEASYSQLQPPLCLKEIEVKSTGTQSDRKVSIFKKITNKMQPPIKMQPPVNMQPPAKIPSKHELPKKYPPKAAQRVSIPKPPAKSLAKPAAVPPAKGMFSWKSLQAKAKQSVQNTDSFMYTLKTQKELVDGDQTIRNAMLKKLFIRKNPFSPRNALMKSLLGKSNKQNLNFMDPLKYKPKMFF